MLYYIENHWNLHLWYGEGCRTIICGCTTQILNWKDGFWPPRNSRIALVVFCRTSLGWRPSTWFLSLIALPGWGIGRFAPQVLDSLRRRGSWNCPWVTGVIRTMTLTTFFLAKFGYIKSLRCLWVLLSVFAFCFFFHYPLVLWHPFTIIYPLYSCNSKDSL